MWLITGIVFLTIWTMPCRWKTCHRFGDRGTASLRKMVVGHKLLKVVVLLLTLLVCLQFFSRMHVLAHVLFCSLAVLDPRVGHTMDVLSPFISIICHSDWLFHRESCPRLDVVYPGRAWSSSPAYTWQKLFLALFLSPGTVSNSSLFAPALLRTHLFVSFAIHAEYFSVLSSQRPQDVFLHSFWVSSVHFCSWRYLFITTLKVGTCVTLTFSVIKALAMLALQALY